MITIRLSNEATASAGGDPRTYDEDTEGAKKPTPGPSAYQLADSGTIRIPHSY